MHLGKICCWLAFALVLAGCSGLNKETYPAAKSDKLRNIRIISAKIESIHYSSVSTEKPEGLCGFEMVISSSVPGKISCQFESEKEKYSIDPEDAGKGRLLLKGETQPVSRAYLSIQFENGQKSLISVEPFEAEVEW